MRFKRIILCSAVLCAILSFGCAKAQINLSFGSDSNRISAGEILPVSVKLVNFGSEKRVDVVAHYQIFDSLQKEAYSESETVAVETTASFVKKLHFPADLKPGIYTVQSSLAYPGQESPAISKFTIVVEKKFGGVFEGDLLFYFVAFLVIVIGVVLFARMLMSWNRRQSIVMHDYSDKPKDQIIYYEILSDIISQMRLRIGDEALEIAQDIPEMKINPKTGLIMDIEKDPAKIIAMLVARYEQLSGHKISFGLRGNKNL